MIETKIKFEKNQTSVFGVGRSLRLGGFGQMKYKMFRIGQFMVKLIRERAAKGIGSDDAPMPPLQRGYAIQKSRAGAGNRRNLTKTGAMLGNISVRYADENKVTIDLTSAKERVKARANEQKAPWWGFSPDNVEALLDYAEQQTGVRSEGFGAGRGSATVFGSVGWRPNPYTR